MKPTSEPRSAAVLCSLEPALRFGAGARAGRDVPFVVLALAMHGVLSLSVGRPPVGIPEVVAVTEVELPPPSKAVVEPPAPEPAHAEATATPLPPVAHAGALVTATANPASAAKEDDLVAFVTDPNGTSYGSGVVGRGGTADHAIPSATPAGTATAQVSGGPSSAPDGLVATSNLSRRAMLQEPNPCAGFYPAGANVDVASVILTVIVRADGGVARVSVVSELPEGQGFGKAAQACLQGKHFEPSLDRSGVAVAASTSIKLRFVR